MKRALVCLFLLCLVCPASYAADSTEKLLEATRVGTVLRLLMTKEADNPPVVSYEFNNGDAGILHEGDTFAAAGIVNLTYANFNPLRISASATQTTSKDPAQQAIDDFAVLLAAQTKPIVADPEVAKSGGGTARVAAAAGACTPVALGLRDAVLTQYKKVHATNDEEKAKEVKQKAEEEAAAVFEKFTQLCVQCDQLKTRRKDLEGSLSTLDTDKFDDAQLQKWVNAANGLAGVQRVRAEVETARDSWKKHRDTADTVKKAVDALRADALAAIADRRTAAPDLVTQSGFSVAEVDALLSCKPLLTDQIFGLDDFAARAQKHLDQGNSMLDGLNALLAVLMATEQRRWANNDKDLIFHTVETDPANIVTPEVTLKMLKYEFDDKKYKISSSVATEAKRKFDVRRGRRLVPEYGVAGVYNDLKYPKYSVKDDETSRTVARTYDTSNVTAAVTLNFLCPTCIGHGVYPGFQIGISKAKDYPGLLGGGVLRFGGATRISIASGVMVTWYKDLNSLTVGGPVESEDKLKNDLKLRRSPAAWYLAVQYTFK